MNIKILMAPEVPVNSAMGLPKEDEYENKGSFFVR